MRNLSQGRYTKSDIPAIVALGVGIALTVSAFLLIQRLEFKNFKDEFIFDTQNYSVALEKSIEGNLNALHAIEGLYASSPEVTRARFHTFASNLLSHSDGIHALRWIPRVAGAARKKYEAAAIRDGYSHYRFAEMDSQKRLVTAGTRHEYFPVYFSESIRNSEGALGLDFSAKPRGRALLEKARDTGAGVASRRIALLLENDPQFAFLVLQPLYRNASPHDTLRERRKNLIGFVQGVFRLEDMISAALKGINLEGIELALFDESADPGKRTLYSTVKQEKSAVRDLNFTKKIYLADRSWTIKFYATPEYLATHKTHYSWAVLAAGLLSSALLALYVLNVKRHALGMERSKNTMTTVLNSINATIAIVDAKSKNVLACNELFIRGSGMTENRVVGKRCDEIANTRPLPCDRLCEQCPLTHATQTGRPASRESIYRGAEGAEKYIELSAFPVRDEAGSVTQTVLSAQDITERKRGENSRLEEQQVRRISAERQVVEAQLRMLQAQIEPHFLFNSLANIVSLIDREPGSAKEMLQHLTRFLRLSLQRSREDASTLAQEAELLKDYLSIFKMRLGPRMDYTIDIPEELLELKFPPMLLQPLVENAIIHGIEPKVEGGRVAIRAEKTDNVLRVTVSDTGLGFSETVNDSGLGLGNVRARLQALYNAGASLVLEGNSPCGATATLEVPL